MDQQRMLDEFLEYATTEASPILDVTTLTSDDVDAGRGPPGTYREPSTNKAWAMWRAAWERASTPTASNYLNVDAMRERVEFLEKHAAQRDAAHRAEVERVARDAVLRALHVERNEGLSKTTKEVVDDAVAAAMRAATAGSGAASAASAASARALGGDGEPVAGSAGFGIVDCDGALYADSRDTAEWRVSVLNRSDIAGKPFRVAPLFTRPAATGDTVGAAARALVKAAIDARADEAVTGIIVPEAEWDALLAALRSTPGGGACG